MTAPATASGPRPLSPRVRTLWHLLWALAMAPVVIAAAVAVVVGIAGDTPLLAVGGAVAVVGAVAAAVVVPRLRYARWRWELTAEGLELAHGVLLRTESAIPVFRVQQIDVNQGPLERALGLVTLRITTASSGSDGTLPGIDAEGAEAVRRELLSRVAADDGV